MTSKIWQVLIRLIDWLAGDVTPGMPQPLTRPAPVRRYRWLRR
jgi:hypothetical protein